MLLIDNIGCLATLVNRKEIFDAALFVENETIFWCGKKSELPDVMITERLDARGCLVLPGLIDCHSHLLFFGSRASEFARRMNHESYESIMQKGGGIQSTVDATTHASDENLFAAIVKRADEIIAQGVTTLEAKSGYGLNLEQELRALRLLKKLDEHHPLDIHRTFLGAHVIPRAFKDTPSRYVSLLIDHMLVSVMKEKLASDCDVFCERGAFSVDDARKILSRAHELGFGLRAHLHQLSNNGGIALVSELPLKSISHADHLTDADIARLKNVETVVEVLPLAMLFLRSPTITPVEALLKARIKLAIATDFNPGSAMCHDLILAARLGITLCGFPVEDALRAITINAAKSLGRDNIGILAKGAQADIIITNCHDINEFFYDWTKHPVDLVIKRGKVVKRSLSQER